jgi:long-chain fatty acid transport protein
MRALAAVLLLTSLARANPVDAFGFGSRGPALANAMSATVDDASANYYNPAALVRTRELHIDLAYRYSDMHLKLNGYDTQVDPSSGLSVAIAAPGHIGSFRFAFGASLYLPDQRLTRLRALPPDQPRFAYYDNRMQRLVLSANLAIQIVPGLYVGAGLTFMSKTQGTLQLQGAVALSNPDNSALVTDIHVDLVAIRYPQAGILWEINRHVAVSVTYRHSFQLSVTQGFNIMGSIGDPEFTPVVPKATLAATTASIDHFQPWQLTAGGAVRFQKVVVMVDLTFARWSEYPVPFSDVDIMLDVGQFNSLIKLPAKRTFPPPMFHDIVIPRLGVEWRAYEGNKLGVDARFGYSYEPSPMPEQIGASNLADSDKHTFSLGAGLELKKLGPILPMPLSFDIHLAVTGLPDRVNRKASPVDQVGDFVASGAIVSVGAGMRVRF